MIKILIVDDDNDKIVRLIKVIRSISTDTEIDVVEDFVSSKRNLGRKSYELLILDLLLPIRKGDEPSFDNSKNLLAEINRSKNILPPRWIVGISQHISDDYFISRIWPTIKYVPSSTLWEDHLSEILIHIHRFETNQSNLEQQRCKVFVEGLSDKKIIHLAFTLFRPDVVKDVEIVSETQAGASWVARQLIVWAHSLRKSTAGKYIRAIGLLDGDIAGNEAEKEIKRVIIPDSAASHTCRTFRLSIGYARHLIALKDKGLLIPVGLEEMYPTPTWQYASDNNWLELRTRPEQLLRDKSAWNGYEISLKDYIENLGLSESEKIYLNTHRIQSKQDMTEYILKLPEEEQRKTLLCFEKLINDLCSYLFES